MSTYIVFTRESTRNILEFPSFEAAKAWYDGPAYREVREHRFRGADYRGVIVEGL